MTKFVTATVILRKHWLNRPYFINVHFHCWSVWCFTVRVSIIEVSHPNLRKRSDSQYLIEGIDIRCHTVYISCIESYYIDYLVSVFYKGNLNQYTIC